MHCALFFVSLHNYLPKNNYMKKRLLNIAGMLLALSLLPGYTYAQSVKTNFDEKVVYTDSLNLPKNTRVTTVLDMLPELLQRPGDFLMSNYDIQVEGMSVGSASDVALTQLQIVDVEQIKINESPISSYNNNGQGGSINIVLRSASDAGKPYWGSAGVVLGYPFNVSPQANIGYKNDKFMVRGMMLGKVSNTIFETDAAIQKDGFLEEYSALDFEEKKRAQLASAYLSYKPTSKDVFKLNVSESYSNDMSENIHVHNVNDLAEQDSKNTVLRTVMNYQHNFGRSTFSVEAQYLYNPTFGRYDQPSMRTYKVDQKSHNISGNVQFTTYLLSPSSTNNPDAATVKLNVGTNFNHNMGTVDLDIFESVIKDDQNVDNESKTWYVMPFANLEASLGKLRLKAVGEYQFIEYKMNMKIDPYTTSEGDFTGKLMAEWHINPHKNLRFVLNRSLQRPTPAQLYPYIYYSPDMTYYVKGNPSLLPMLSHKFAVDYISDYKWKNNQSLLLNLGAGFERVSETISPYFMALGEGNALSGLVDNVISFRNYGTSNIYNANLMALYSYKAFSISFAGNWFYNDMNGVEDADHHYSYFNFSLYPHFNLSDGWHGGAKFVYYSKVDRVSEVLSDCAITRMTIGKSWKKFFVYLFQEVALHKHAEDTFHFEDGSMQINTYDMIPNSMGVGMKVRF